MIENQLINGREVWLKIDPKPVERENDNVIPREYFTARYYFRPPNDDINNGEPITGEDGSVKLFESPVAALTHAWKAIKEKLGASADA